MNSPLREILYEINAIEQSLHSGIKRFNEPARKTNFVTLYLRLYHRWRFKLSSLKFKLTQITFKKSLFLPIYCQSAIFCRYCKRFSSLRRSWIGVHREKRQAFPERNPVEDIRQFFRFVWLAFTYTVKSSDSLGSVNLHQPVDHSTVAFVVGSVDIVVVLQTQTRFDNPDGICHEKCENSGFACCQHVQCWAEGLSGVAALNPSFDCVVAVNLIW